MGQPRTAADCARIEKSPTGSDPGAPAGCTAAQTHQTASSASASNNWGNDGAQTSITVIDDSWGVPGLGTDGTLALGGMAIAAATVTIIAWRALTPPKLVRR